MKNVCLIITIILGLNTFADTTSIAVQPTDTTTIDTAIQSNIQNTIVDSTPKEIERQTNNFLLRTQNTELWVFIVCCLTFLLAGINRRINEKKHDQTILVFLNFNPISQSVNRSFFEFNIHQLIGLIVHNLVLSFWCFYFLKGTSFQIIPSNLLYFILLFFAVSLVYISKFFFQYLALNILQLSELAVLIVKSIVSIGYFTALITLPLFMIIYYVQNSVWQHNLEQVVFAILGIYLLFRSFKIFQLFLQFFGISFFYNILYFCGLEIIPLLVLIKLMMNLF